jgi:hypothetical protein
MKWIRGAAVALATLGMTIPNAPAIAAGPTAKGPSVKVVNTRVFDISLSNGGTFKGRVVDHTGSPLEGAEVSVKQNNKVVGRAVSDKSGTFAVANLKAGIYTMSSGNTEGQFRTWSENTAPPTAKDQGLLVMGETVPVATMAVVMTVAVA